MHFYVKGEVDLYIMFYLYTIIYHCISELRKSKRIYSSVDKKNKSKNSFNEKIETKPTID